MTFPGAAFLIGKPFTPHPEGYKNAADLVAGIRKLMREGRGDPQEGRAGDERADRPAPVLL